MKPWTPTFVVIALLAYVPLAAAADAPPIAAFAPCPWGSDDCNVCVADAVDSINRLRDHNDAMGFQMNGFPDVSNDNHWEGVQRLMGGAGRYLAISRRLGDETIDVSFAVVEMASRNGEGLRFRSNRLDPLYNIDATAPPTNDRIVVTMPHESGFLHAGGIQALGNILAVPFETGGTDIDTHHSKVVFYDLADPLHPSRLSNEVDHSPLSDEAGTATLGKLANGHFLLVIGRVNAEILDFYVSTGTDLRTTGYEWFYTWSKDELTGRDTNCCGYQALNFIAQSDGTLFMAGTHRTTPIDHTGIGGGEDFIDLFTVSNGTGNSVSISKVADKHLFCNTCDFDAAGGVYTDPGGQLYVYGAKHDNDGVPVSGALPVVGGAPTNCDGPDCSTQFGEFRPVPHGTCGQIEDAWAELYEDSGLGGRSLMVDFVDRELEDYADFHQAEDFEDITSSVVWCIPPRATFRLWENKNPCGGSYLDLVGDGTFRTISDLGSVDFGDTASCAEWLGGPFARAGADRTVECTGSTTPVQLDGGASISLAGEPLTFSWQAAGVAFDDPNSATPTGGFPLAQTPVMLTVSDSAGSDTATVNVTVVDTIAPTISCPADLVVDATTPGGALVDYPAPTAADNCSVGSVACTPPSGSTFAVGDSMVGCTASDTANNSSACSFTIHVKGAAEQSGDLITVVNGLAIKSGVQNSLLAKLNAALARLQGKNPAAACGSLRAFMNEVDAQRGKSIAASDADALVTAASQIMAANGCT